VGTRRAQSDLKLRRPGANKEAACAHSLGRLCHHKFISSDKGKLELRMVLHDVLS
jgi:hypothetical protein